MSVVQMDYAAAASLIEPADVGAMARADARQDTLTKPPRSLGQLEDLSIRLAGMFSPNPVRIRDKAIVIAAADHGVVAQGVAAYPQSVTAQMVLNFLSGGAAINVMCRQLGIRQVIVDAGVATILPLHPHLRSVKLGPGTADMTQGPAMTRKQAESALNVGVALVGQLGYEGVDLIGTGDMGIGNTTASAAITSVITGLPPEETTGDGAGVPSAGLEHKIEVIRRAIEVNDPDPEDGLAVLEAVGGFEIGVLAGVIIGAAVYDQPVVLDGFISGAAALIAQTIAPASRDYMIAAHLSAEPGHFAALDHLELTPLLDLGMRLGEGTGAALAMPIIEAAAATLSEMATFDEAGVSGPADEPGTPRGEG